MTRTETKARIGSLLLLSLIMQDTSCIAFANESTQQLASAASISSNNSEALKSETTSNNTQTSSASAAIIKDTEHDSIDSYPEEPAKQKLEAGWKPALPVELQSESGRKPGLPVELQSIKTNQDAKPQLIAQNPTDGSTRINADPSSTPLAVDNLSKQILLKEIALEKFNLHYRQNAAVQGRWKGWRYAASAEANSGLGLAGGIISVYNRGVHVHRADQVKRQLQKKANLIPMIGNIIGSAAAANEFMVNEYHEWDAWRKGFSATQARKFVASTKNDIDRLMRERDALIRIEESTPELAAEAELHRLEGRVLTDLQDQSLLEFQRFHLNARNLMAFQQMQYFFDLAKNTTGAIGYDFAWLSLHRRRRVWNYRAGVLFTVSGALTMGGPIVSRGFAKLVTEYHKRTLKDTIENREAAQVATLEADQKALAQYVVSGRVKTEGTGLAIKRGEVYGNHSKYFQDQYTAAEKQVAKSKLVATQNIGAGMYVGGSKIASGILFIIPGYLQLYNTNTQTATRITNSDLLAAGIVGLPASSFQILDTLRIQVRGELDRHNLAKQGKLPGQLIQARLKQLDEMEAAINAGP